MVSGLHTQLVVTRGPASPWSTRPRPAVTPSPAPAAATVGRRTQPRDPPRRRRLCRATPESVMSRRVTQSRHPVLLMMGPMDIELLVVPGCRNEGPADTLLRSALVQAALPSGFRVTVIADEQEAGTTGFHRLTNISDQRIRPLREPPPARQSRLPDLPAAGRPCAWIARSTRPSRRPYRRSSKTRRADERQGRRPARVTDTAPAFAAALVM